MPKSKKKRAARRTEEQAPSAKAKKINWKEKRPAFIIGAVVIVFMLVIFGISYYPTYIAPLRLTVVTVDDVSIRMDYFLKRCRASGSDPMTMLEQLTNEQLIKLEAPRYVEEISPEDIDEGLRLMASGGSGNITESEFSEWYRQQLNESRLSDSEYREIVGTSLLSARLHEYLAERVSTVAEQVHLHIILLETYEDAVEVRARWEAGEDFADLAREVSIDEQSGENGGEVGWFPRGVLESSLDYVAFNLDIGQVSEPQPYASEYEAEEPDYYLLMMVSEKADARELDESNLQIVKAQALQDWLSQEAQYHEIEYNFNSEIYAWLNWQLTKE